MKELKELLGALVLMVIGILYAAFVGGFAFYLSYKWLIITHFLTAPTLSYFNCIALSTFTTLIFKSTHIDKRKIKNEYSEKCDNYWYILFLSPWFTILAAWIISLVIN